MEYESHVTLVSRIGSSARECISHCLLSKCDGLSRELMRFLFIESSSLLSNVQLKVVLPGSRGGDRSGNIRSYCFSAFKIPDSLSLWRLTVFPIDMKRLDPRRLSKEL